MERFWKSKGETISPIDFIFLVLFPEVCAWFVVFRCNSKALTYANLYYRLDGKLIEQEVYHISLQVIAIATHQDKYNRISDKNSASIVPLCSLKIYYE